jgi:uncharacterized membrane protein (DUF485 family)
MSAEIQGRWDVHGVYAWSTIVISALTLVSSAMGIFMAGTYARDTPNWAMQARAQDVANVAAVFILLMATYYMSKHSAHGFQVWAGVLLFLIYAFVIYAFASSFNNLFLLYVATLGLLMYTFLGAVVRLDFETMRERAMLSSRQRLALGLTLVLLGFFFYFLWLSQDIPALLNGTVPSDVTQAGLLVNPIHVLDMALYLPAFIMDGKTINLSRH